jgi:hypothetical protein
MRLDAMKLILQAKGHLREKGNTVKAQEHINYILGD